MRTLLLISDTHNPPNGAHDMTSNRSFPIAILIAAFVIAGAIIAQPATGTKARTIGQGEIGVVDIYHLVDILIMSDDASDQRAQFEADGNAQITQYEQRLLGIQTQMQGISQDDPQAARLISEYQQVNQQIQQATNQINNGYQQLLANQIADAYVSIHAATNEVSAQEGYTFVLSTRRGADLVQTSTLTGVTQEILARPLVTPPEAVDITDAVRIHMGLPTLEEITAQIEAEQAEAAAAAEAQQLKAELDAANQAEETDPTPATEITDE